MFFRNAFAEGKVCSSFFGMMQIMYHGDGRPVLPLHIKWLENMVSECCELSFFKTQDVDNK